MNLTAIVALLEQARRDTADGALTKPSGKTPFDYGRAVGLVAGLQHAQDIIEKYHRDEQERLNNM